MLFVDSRLVEAQTMTSKSSDLLEQSHSAVKRLDFLIPPPWRSPWASFPHLFFPLPHGLCFASRNTQHLRPPLSYLSPTWLKDVALQVPGSLDFSKEVCILKLMEYQ